MAVVVGFGLALAIALAGGIVACYFYHRHRLLEEEFYHGYVNECICCVSSSERCLFASVYRCKQMCKWPCFDISEMMMKNTVTKKIKRPSKLSWHPRQNKAVIMRMICKKRKCKNQNMYKFSRARQGISTHVWRLMVAWWQLLMTTPKAFEVDIQGILPSTQSSNLRDLFRTCLTKWTSVYFQLLYLDKRGTDWREDSTSEGNSQQIVYRYGHVL